MVKVEMVDGKVVIKDETGEKAGSLDPKELRRGALVDKGKERPAAKLPVSRLRFANGSFAAQDDQTVAGARFEKNEDIA